LEIRNSGQKTIYQNAVAKQRRLIINEKYW
jgi:hypothetical protein